MLIVRALANVVATALGYCVFTAGMCLLVYAVVWVVFGDTRSAAEETRFCQQFPTECNAYR